MKYNPNLAKELNREVELKELAKKRKKQGVEEAVEPAISNQYSFLEGSLAEQVHEYITRNYPDLPKLSSIQPGKGSNSFYVTAVNDYFRANNIKIRTASQSELEHIIKNNLLKLTCHYEDTGLVLRSTGNPNEYLAKHLANQLNPSYPLMIPLNGLTLIKDNRSPHKYSFQLTNETKLIHAPVLNSKPGQKFNETDDNGLPLLGNGTRTLYTGSDKSGLSRLYMDWNLDLSSNDENLASSFDNGRVVLVSPEGARL